MARLLTYQPRDSRVGARKEQGIMTIIKLTESQAWTAINALHTAAETYETDARTCPELRTQFERQAEQARDLASLIARS